MKKKDLELWNVFEEISKNKEEQTITIKVYKSTC
jgi:hypothetical protein